jgi:hypothetical protein
MESKVFLSPDVLFRALSPDVSFRAWQWQDIALVKGNIVP